MRCIGNFQAPTQCYRHHGQSSSICVRLFRAQCNRIAPSLREHICITLDRPSVKKYWGTGSENGDVKMIKNAGGTITNPFDSTVHSLLVAIYELGVTEVMIIGHTGCGVQGMDANEMLNLMRSRGISDEYINLMMHCGIDLKSWLHGFEDTHAAVEETVDLVRNHPLIPTDVTVKGYIMDSLTGELSAL